LVCGWGGVGVWFRWGGCGLGLGGFGCVGGVFVVGFGFFGVFLGVFLVFFFFFFFWVAFFFFFFSGGCWTVALEQRSHLYQIPLPRLKDRPLLHTTVLGFFFLGGGATVFLNFPPVFPCQCCPFSSLCPQERTTWCRFDLTPHSAGNDFSIDADTTPHPRCCWL